MKNYNQAPLPFQGQKRRFLKDFKIALNEFSAHATYVDLFGGSGLLSHTVKQQYPNSTVVYNDYDSYTQRIANIPQTNNLIADIRKMVIDVEDNKGVPPEVKEKIINRVNKEKGFVDYITLSASLLFSGKYATSFKDFGKQTFYNRVIQNPYNADGYLQGVSVVKMDYKDLFRHYAKHANVVFLIDPPYLSTDCSSYGSDKYWKLVDYLDVMDTLTSGNYFYFTSNKSSVVELCEWIANKTGGINPFAGASTKTVGGTVNYTATYTDIMLYKHTQSSTNDFKKKDTKTVY